MTNDKELTYLKDTLKYSGLNPEQLLTVNRIESLARASERASERAPTDDIKRFVLRAHNIEITDEGFVCNDGDIFDDVWRALEHTIWLDLMTKRITDDGKERDCNDYYEIIEERPSNQSNVEAARDDKHCQKHF